MSVALAGLRLNTPAKVRRGEAFAASSSFRPQRPGETIPKTTGRGSVLLILASKASRPSCANGYSRCQQDTSERARRAPFRALRRDQESGVEFVLPRSPDIEARIPTSGYDP